jgi:glycosyltransferase involved in cell wall biosynthesis
MFSADSLEVVIFSFNRGGHLRNCVDSVREFMPNSRVTVFDDGSTNSETCAALDRLRKEGVVSVLTADESSKNSKFDTQLNGGLHANMQTFIDDHACSALVLFLQDDTQVVRKVKSRDLEDIARIFQYYPRAAFIYPAFLANRTACTRGFVDFSSFRDDDPSFSFHYHYEYSGFFDICIAHVGRLRASGWKFGNELTTSLQAREKFGTMRLMRTPFVALVPAPPTYVFRGKTWVQRIWERYRAGLYPVDPMSEAAVERMSALKADYPTADEFLTSRSFQGEHPWPYTKMERAPKLLVLLERIEAWVRRRLSWQTGK